MPYYCMVIGALSIAIHGEAETFRGVRPVISRLCRTLIKPRKNMRCKATEA